MRNVDDLLPSRYRNGAVYWRRMPAVPSKWVREEHLMLISILSTGPQTVATLVEQSGYSEAAVCQSLAALYFGGSLTADARKAGPTRVAKPAKSEDWPSSMTSAFVQPQPTIPPRPGKRTRADMPTVPSPLEQPGKE